MMGGTILHLGLGAFHRAHQADYTHDANRASGENWSIEAVSMRNPQLAQDLNAQGGAFSLLLRGAEGPAVKPITCMGRAWSLPDEPRDIIARFADPAVSVVTITVTEKGYTQGADGQPNWNDPVVAHDRDNPEEPKGLLGLLVAGLDARRSAEGGGLTLLSCDNLPDNGAVLKRLVLAFADRHSDGLAEWIEMRCTFPSSMVDRITPASTERTFADVLELSQRDDRLAVETEPFRQWVIEDNFAGPRPAWEKAGALFVGAVQPFEHAKLRMLNGPHSFIAYMGALLGKEAVRDVMAEPLLARAVRWHMDKAARSLHPIEGFSFKTYADDLIARFKNPAIVHKCLQIAMDGSQKLPQRILMAARDLKANGHGFESCALATATWLRFLEGRSEAGETLPLNDPMADRLREVVTRAEGDASRLVVDAGALFGPSVEELWATAEWQRQVIGKLENIRSRGLRDTLGVCLKREGV